MLYRLELQRLKTALNIFVPDQDTNNADHVLAQRELACLKSIVAQGEQEGFRRSFDLAANTPKRAGAAEGAFFGSLCRATLLRPLHNGHNAVALLAYTRNEMTETPT